MLTKEEKLEQPIMVTGGAGFIGSQIVDRLLAQDYETHVLDNMSNGNPKFVEKCKKNPNFKFFKLDLLEKESLEELKKYKLIYHCAADPEVRTSISEPESHFTHNVMSTLNILEATRDSVENFVFLSTSTVYGDAKTIPTPEDYSPMEKGTAGFFLSVFKFGNFIWDTLIKNLLNIP